MQGIEIPIGAPLGQLDKDLKGAENKLKGFAAEASKSAAVLGGSVVKGSNQAAFALTNLGRVAQDAPFGFIGIQNNLNPLLESFQRLKAETGGTGSALKALGQSLIGPAGLGIALSVVSAGILFYQQYQQRANKEVTTAKKVTDEYINSLGQVQQAQLKGAQAAQSELTTLKLLYSQYQNSTLPLEQRKDAYKEIQKLYPAYFGNLGFEATATNKTKDAYNSLTESILASARSRAAADLITKNSTRQLENEQKIIDLNTQIQNERTKQLKLQNTVESQNLLAKQEANILTSKQADIVNKYLTAGAKEAELIKLKNNLLTDSNILTQKNIQLEKSVNKEIDKGGKVSGNVGGDALQKGKMPKADNTANEAKKRAEDLAKEANAFAVKMLKSIQDFQIDVSNLAAEKKAKINFIDPDQLQSAVALTDMFQKEIFGNLQKVNKHLVDFNQQASDIINSSLVETFAGIGNAIGESLANGTSLAQNLGASLLNSLGSVLGQLGQMAIAAGLGIKAIKIALETLNPFVAIAAGVALLALSGVVKGQASKIGKSMGGGGGGGSSGGGSVPVPQGSATISTSAAGSSQNMGGGVVVFEISGTNLIGVLNRAGAKLTRFGP
jgi:hypothetical protein